MKRRRSKLIALGLVAMLGLTVLPSAATAGSLGFRNDTDGPVIVQGMSIIRGKIYAGKRHVLQPGDVGWDHIVAQGNKLVVVADAKQPTKTLYQGTIQFLGNTQFYSIKLAGAPVAKDPPTKKKSGDKPPKAQKLATPKIELEATTPPPMAATAPMPRR